jgi:hypothetical protein
MLQHAAPLYGAAFFLIRSSCILAIIPVYVPVVNEIDHGIIEISVAVCPQNILSVPQNFCLSFCNKREALVV